jgi:dTDP-glucose 4,6-dehydratase
MTHIVITGACGFIGHHVVQHILKTTNLHITIIDSLSYASCGFQRLREIGALPSQNNRVRAIYTYNLCNSVPACMRAEIGHVDFVLHLAAETHVDRSIADPAFCIRNNVMSALNVLEYVREIEANINAGVVLLYFSTDEVMGSAPSGVAFKECDRRKPGNAYSCSKGCGELMCDAYANTYKTKIIIVNVMNAIGERQHVEKFVPKVIKHILDGTPLNIHTDEFGTPGARTYIHSRNIAAAVCFILENGIVGETYNVVGELEMNNLEMAEFISEVMGLPVLCNLSHFDETRLGHDLVYRLDGSKLAKLGWQLPLDFRSSLTNVILWTLENKHWLLDDPQQTRVLEK